MKKTILTIAVAAMGLVAIAGNGPKTATKKTDDTFKVAADKSTFRWDAKKVTGAHYGSMKFTEGTITVAKKSLTGGTFVIDMNSIEVQDLTGEWKDKLTGHLKSDDFFSTTKYGTSTLVIKKVTPIKGAKPGESNYNVVADLTIKGITSEVSFPAFVIIKADEVVANAEFAIDRTKYDIKYGSGKFIADIGDKAIDDNFKVKVRVVAVK